MGINPGYFVGEALSSFRRNWVMSLVAVTIVYVSLLLVGASFLTGALLEKVITSFEQKVSVQIFLKDGAASGDVEALQSALLKDDRIDEVTYVSKAQALERFKQRTRNAPQLVEQLRGNPLPASLEIKLVDPKEVKLVVASIKKQPTLAKVVKNPNDPEKDLKYGQEVIDNLFAATNVIRMFMITFVVVLLLVSLVLIGNTIRLAIFARRREIGIMRLVGASNWFIRTPFLMEGVLQSLIGALLAVFTLMAAQSLVVPWLQRNLRFLPVNISGGTIAQLFVLVVVSGIVMGLAGSGIAVRRYLKV